MTLLLCWSCIYVVSSHGSHDLTSPHKGWSQLIMFCAVLLCELTDQESFLGRNIAQRKAKNIALCVKICPQSAWPWTLFPPSQTKCPLQSSAAWNIPSLMFALIVCPLFCVVFYCLFSFLPHCELVSHQDRRKINYSSLTIYLWCAWKQFNRRQGFSFFCKDVDIKQRKTENLKYGENPSLKRDR